MSMMNPGERQGKEHKNAIPGVQGALWIGSLLACVMLRRQKERVEKNILDGEHYTGSSK